MAFANIARFLMLSECAAQVLRPQHSISWLLCFKSYSPAQSIEQSTRKLNRYGTSAPAESSKFSFLPQPRPGRIRQGSLLKLGCKAAAVHEPVAKDLLLGYGLLHVPEPSRSHEAIFNHAEHRLEK